jgi:alginate O-acetyltransferase complex protein AlgI
VLPRRFLLVQNFAAMLATMALCGLWHGASWTFVLWGTLHGVALVICSLWRRYCPRLPWLLGWALTVAFVLLTCVIFRAGTLDAALRVFEGLGTMPDLGRVRRMIPILIAGLIAVLLPASQDIVARLTRQPKTGIALLLGIAVLAILIPVGERTVNDFIYFQF